MITGGRYQPDTVVRGPALPSEPGTSIPSHRAKYVSTHSARDTGAVGQRVDIVNVPSSPFLSPYGNL